MSKTFCQVKLKDISYKLFYLEDRYFPPPWYIHLLYFFLKSTYFHQQKRVNWFNKLSYKNKYISGLHYFLELAISTLSATLQDGGLIDQVDRERGANRNQSREIQFIHAKRLTHHSNTRYTLLVMDSWFGLNWLFFRTCLAFVALFYRIFWVESLGFFHFKSGIYVRRITKWYGIVICTLKIIIIINVVFNIIIMIIILILS